MKLCRSCHRALDQTTEHRFEEHYQGITTTFSLCESCCPNCFGGVGGTRENPQKPDDGVITIP